MPDLRFDTDQGHDTVSQLRSILESVRTESETIRSRVDNLVGADWEAPAAHAFQSEMANWYQNIASTLTFLEDLINRLTMEIQQWEETAAQLGGGAIGAATTGGFPSGYGGTPSGYDSMGNFGGGDSGHYTYGGVPPMPGSGFDPMSPGSPGIPGLQVDTFGYTTHGSGSWDFSEGVFTAEGSFGADVYAIQAEYNGEFAGFDVTAQGQVGASITGEGSMEIDLIQGTLHAEGGIEAFAGATAEAEISRDFGAVEVEAEANVGVGIGGSLSGELGYDSGVLTVGLDASAYLGIGGGIDFDVELDVGEAVDTVVDLADDAADLIGDMLDPTSWF